MVRQQTQPLEADNAKMNVLCIVSNMRMKYKNLDTGQIETRQLDHMQ